MLMSAVVAAAAELIDEVAGCSAAIESMANAETKK